MPDCRWRNVVLAESVFGAVTAGAFRRREPMARLGKVRPQDPVAIAEQIERRGLSRQGFAQLPRGRLRGRISCDAKAQDAPRVARHYEKHVRHLERSKRDIGDPRASLNGGVRRLRTF